MTADEDAAVLRNVSKTYARGHESVAAVQDATLTVARGQLALVMGPSGAGKTTLLHLMAGVERSDRGEITMGSARLDSMSEQELTRFRRQNVGFVFQKGGLVDELSVWDNIDMPLQLCRWPRRERVPRVGALLEYMQLTRQARALPRTLSGGEMQRVAIARAMAHRPLLVIADEPTANLDHRLGDGIVRILRALCEEDGIAVVLASHDCRLQEHAHTMVRMEDGHVTV